MDFAAILQMANFFEVKPGHESVGGGPLGTDHHVVAGLIPEIIAEFYIAHVIFPTTDNFKVFVEV